MTTDRWEAVQRGKEGRSCVSWRGGGALTKDKGAGAVFLPPAGSGALHTAADSALLFLYHRASSVSGPLNMLHAHVRVLFLPVRRLI